MSCFGKSLRVRTALVLAAVFLFTLTAGPGFLRAEDEGTSKCLEGLQIGLIVYNIFNFFWPGAFEDGLAKILNDFIFCLKYIEFSKSGRG